MQIIIRMDDITPDMDWEKFYKVKGVLDKYNIKPLLGIVPDCKDDLLHFEEPHSDFFEVIRGLVREGYEIAQHGTYHMYETEETGLLGINPFSEYAGISYDVQYEKIKAGKDILNQNGIETDVFMAPGHTFDENTLKALKALDFKALTDGLYSEAYVREGIICVPCRLARMDVMTGFDTLCLHSNLMSDADIKELEMFADLHSGEFVTFSSVIEKGCNVNYSSKVKHEEEKVLKKRLSKNKIAESKRLGWYLAYTNHSNSKVKWIKRIVLLPLLLTNKYKGNNREEK